jgi:signal transduction histidine kinase
VIVERGPLRVAGSLVWLPIVLVASFVREPPPAHPLGAVVAATAATTGWALLGWMRENPPWWWTPAGVAATGLGGVALLATTRSPTPFTFLLYAVLIAAVRLPVTAAAGTLAGTVIGLVAVSLGAAPAVVTVYVLLLVAILLFGMGRRESAHRAEQRELAVVATARAHEEHARAAALDERARIARDVHDVLAHSLSALAVQLQGARLMLLRDGAPPDTVAQVERAQRLAADGLAEARKAVTALRTEPVDVVEGLRTLVADAPDATLQIDGEPVDLVAGERETVLRTAQEALTNARRHAAGAPVHVRLTRIGEATELEVHDRGGPPAPRRPGGYGLTGMAERAALAGAELEAGPVADGWRVRLRLPAANEVQT